ncbi:hypothetical protein HAX54_034153, partial [Datura stramonium]|nr:hypothetical protein [Datura stramonium]
MHYPQCARLNKLTEEWMKEIPLLVEACIPQVGSCGFMRNAGVKKDLCIGSFSDLSKDMRSTYMMHVGIYVSRVAHMCTILKGFSS